MPVTHPHTRGSIHQEDALILQHQHHSAGQHILRLEAPLCAATAAAGQFVHLQCDPLLPLRRPLSIMRANAQEQWIELLYKEVGYGTSLLASRDCGERLNLLGPIGNTFNLSRDKPVRILIGGGVGIPPMIFLAEAIARQFPEDRTNTLMIMGSEVPFPFDLQPSALAADRFDSKINQSLTDMESLGIASRLCSLQNFDGCYQGYAPDLARQYLEDLADMPVTQIELYSCGPHPMLAAVKKLAAEFNLSCQVSLEETMACAVGGCAGCVVELELPEGKAMKRVCVDGPVFDARQVNF